MQFQAELKEIKAKKLASLDMSYRIIFETSDPNVLSLGAVSPETLFKVEVTPNA